MLRVLFVGQSYITGESRKKLSYLAASSGHVVGLVVPTGWEHDAFGRYEFRFVEADRPLSIFPIPIRNSGRAFAFSYAVAPLWRAVDSFQADIVQAEQEPGSLALFQVMAMVRSARRAKLIAFTWENLAYRQPGIRHYLETVELANLDHLLVGNIASAEVFREKGYRGSLTVLPNVGVDEARFAPRPAGAVARALGVGGRFVIGFVGRLVPEKGVSDLLWAFVGLPKTCHLVFVGGGPLRDELLREAENLGVASRVTFHPTVPHAEVADYMNCLNCLVLPSRTIPGGWREQFGLVLAQAMACGVPVVGSNSGAIPEVIGDAGLIFPEGEVHGLREGLLRLHDDARLCAELGAKGRRRVLAYYTNRGIAERTSVIWRDLMRRP